MANFAYLLSNFLCILIILGCVTITIENSDHEWDFLIFTQRWPTTACSQWEEANKNNTCAFPDPKDLWTIHGIWPTKFGTKGPCNCDNTWRFNDTILEPIKDNLENYWTNVEKNTQLDSLWKHEWLKHGTCAASLPQLNNELNYFKKGLEWIKEFNMKTILFDKHIVPNQFGYPVQEIFDSVTSILNTTAIIECVTDRITKLSLISEVRICFDKMLNLMDCDGAKHDYKYIKAGGILTNCNIGKPVMYYPNNDTKISREAAKKKSSVTKPTDVISKVSAINSFYNTREYLLKYYSAIKFLVWATM